MSLHSATYRRIWLSVKPHPGYKVSCNQLQEMVHSAEASTGVRPRRRTELLEQRIEALSEQGTNLRIKLETAQQKEAAIQGKREEVVEQIQVWHQEVARLETDYQTHNRQERPHSALG